MARYHHGQIGEFAHQLKLSPVKLRLKQLAAIEYLIDLVEPEKGYPYDFVCHQITGYRPRSEAPQRPMAGKTLIGDLVLLVEELSNTPVLPAGIVRPCWTTEELASRLNVSSKTICRWRKRGLPGRKLRFPDGTVRMAFLERSVRRFVTKNRAMVERGAAFKQLTASEKEAIVKLAREILSDRRMKLHELSQLVAARVSRAVETVRYTLRRYDQSHPDEALFADNDQPIVSPDLQEIYDAVKDGTPIASVAERFGKTPKAVRDIVREVRARLLEAAPIECIYNEEFETPDADERILAVPLSELTTPPKKASPPSDLPPYLQDLYRQPLLEPDQERSLFRRYNYLKFKAERLRRQIDVLTVSDAVLDDIEGLLEEAEQTKNVILQANLRLVVSIARRHVGRSSAFFETVSDGNLSLMRAVDKFDYGRGFKFSTYASWAVMRNYARTIPEQLYASSRLVTSSDEMLAATPAEDTTSRDTLIESARHLIHKGLGLLNPREREIVVKHYGLGKDSEPMTLDQIGQVFGVTKERVRQIERKALSKLRGSLGDAEGDFLEA